MKPLSAVNYVSSTRKSEVTGWVRVQFFGAGGAFLGVIWRDRRDPYSLQLGRVRGFLLPGCDRTAVRPHLANTASTK